jgi:hypothetical protein
MPPLSGQKVYALYFAPVPEREAGIFFHPRCITGGGFILNELTEVIMLKIQLVYCQV